MENDPESIRKDIEKTRARMEGTVEALAYKTDVPARAKDTVSDALDAAQAIVGDAAESVRAKMSDVAADAAGAASAGLPSGEQTRAAFSGAKKLVSDNPLGLVMGSVAVGFLVGLAFPVSKLERDQIGPIGEQLTDNAKAAASGMVAQGKAAVSQVVSDALSENGARQYSAS